MSFKRGDKVAIKWAEEAAFGKVVGTWHETGDGGTNEVFLVVRDLAGDYDLHKEEDLEAVGTAVAIPEEGSGSHYFVFWDDQYEDGSMYDVFESADAVEDKLEELMSEGVRPATIKVVYGREIEVDVPRITLKG